MVTLADEDAKAIARCLSFLQSLLSNNRDQLASMVDGPAGIVALEQRVKELQGKLTSTKG